MSGTTAEHRPEPVRPHDHPASRAAGITLRAALVPVLLGGVLAACSTATSAGQSSSTTPPPTGPAATFSHQLTGGSGAYIGSPITVDLKGVGYVQHEYAASGRATSYRDSGALTRDGRWSFVPDGTASYRTRVLVRYPANPARFSGTVVVEWLNVSGGVDADPEWATLHEELIRQGDAWVGVSAQRIGVMGGPVLVAVTGVAGANLAGEGLQAIDPARYGSLNQPGDGFSFDIYTQVARAIRARRGPRRAASATGHRRRRIAIGVRPRDVLQRRSTPHPRIRRLLRAQPGRGRSAAGRRPASTPTSPTPSAAPRRSSAPTRTRRCSTSKPRPTWGASSTRTRPATRQ